MAEGARCVLGGQPGGCEELGCPEAVGCSLMVDLHVKRDGGCTLVTRSKEVVGALPGTGQSGQGGCAGVRGCWQQVGGVSRARCWGRPGSLAAGHICEEKMPVGWGRSGDQRRTLIVRGSWLG